MPCSSTRVHCALQPDRSKDAPQWPWGLWVSAGLLATGSFLSGWHTAVLNTTLDEGEVGSLLHSISLSVPAREAASALTIAGGAVGSAMAFIPQRFGYRPTILCTNLIFIGGTLLTLFPTLETLLVGRVLVGIAVGINNTTAPVLLSEIAPDAVRGLFTTMHQLGITIGILASGLAGFGFVSYVPMGWRYLFMLGFICPAVQLLFGWYFLPESPRWLLRQAQHEKARAV